MNGLLAKLKSQFDTEFRRTQEPSRGMDVPAAAAVSQAGRSSARPSALAVIACPTCRIELPRIADVCPGCGTNVGG